MLVSTRPAITLREAVLQQVRAEIIAGRAGPGVAATGSPARARYRLDGGCQGGDAVPGINLGLRIAPSSVTTRLRQARRRDARTTS